MRWYDACTLATSSKVIVAVSFVVFVIYEYRPVRKKRMIVSKPYISLDTVYEHLFTEL